MSDHALGNVIRKRRAELGLTQEELADRISDLGDATIRQSDISRLERGLVNLPHRERLARLAQALEMSLVEMLAEAGWFEGVGELDQLAGEQPDAQVRSPDAPEPAQADSISAYREPVQLRNPGLKQALDTAWEHRRAFERNQREFKRMLNVFQASKQEFDGDSSPAC